MTYTNQLIHHLLLTIQQQSKKIDDLEVVMTNLPGSVYWKDYDGVYLGRNQYAQRKMQTEGLEWQHCEGLTDFDLFDQETAEKFRVNDLKVMNSKTETVSEENYLTADGKIHINYSLKRPLIKDDVVTGILGVSIDITDLKLIEKELRLAKEKEEEANLLKKNFMLNIEHDMRTPAANIRALSNKVLKQELSNPARDDLQDILLCSENLMMYISKIVEFNQLSQGQLTAQKNACSIAQCVQSAIATYSANIKLQPISINSTITDKVPTSVITDRYLIFSILSNLINNAIKFTDHGEISIDTNYEPVNKDHGTLIIKVSDTGIGIAKNHLKFIYDIFYRVEASNTEKYEGRGLGLSIVKTAIGILRGDIQVLSSEGKGTTFICTIPVNVDYMPRNQNTDIINFTDKWKNLIKNVLVIDDNNLCLKVAADTLNDQGIDVSIAENAKEALDTTNTKPFDLILIDIGLPDSDGFTLAKKIAQSKYNSNTILIALTAHDKKSLQNEYLNSPFQGLLVKPLDINELFGELNTINNPH